MKKIMKWIFATGAALTLLAFVSSPVLAGGYSFGFGYRSGGGHYGWRGGGWGHPRYAYNFGFTYAPPPPVYYAPPAVVYQPYYYAPPPVYYYSGGAFYYR